MSKFIINGKNKLSGNWHVQGMKNAATPVLAATLLTRDECTLYNVPRIKDIDHMISILHTLGAKTSWKDEHTLSVQTYKIISNDMDYLLTKRMRSSVLFIGPLLGILGSVKMPEPGGCNIGNRSLDTHFSALKSIGAKINREDGYYTISSDSLQGSQVSLPEKSVTATENLIMASVLADGITVIKNSAQEPHILCLCEFLNAMGAKISGYGSDEIIIKGVKKLKGVDFEIIPDQLEIGTISVLGALCGENIEISPVVPEHMNAVLDKLREAGVNIEEKENSWLVQGLKSKINPFLIETAPFPGFPTDLQAPFGVLATQANGKSVIHDPMYENRLGYINELVKMGADARIKDEHTAEIFGPIDLKGYEIHSLDLRAGATLIIAGLIANGQTTLCEAENIDRGYEKIDERLAGIGASIKRVE